MSTESTEADRSAGEPSGPLLTVTLEGQVIRTLALGEQVVSIGRLPENVLVLSDPRVSRRHAELRVDPTGIVVTDLASASGTFVGGNALLPNRPIIVPPGESIRIGPYLLTAKQPAFRIEIPGFEEPQAIAAPVRPAEPVVEAAIPSIEARPTFASPNALGPTSRYLIDLPAIFQEPDNGKHDGNGSQPLSDQLTPPASFLSRMLLIYESVWEPLEQRQDHIGMYYDPRTCPVGLLPFLAGWLQLSLDRHWPEPRRRRLLREAMDLYRWRGTPFGLTRMIEVCTGLAPTVTEDPARPYTFSIKVRLPAGSEVRRDFVQHLVEAHKPAHVGYTLEFTG
jgi:phage tail-like protein